MMGVCEAGTYCEVLLNRLSEYCDLLLDRLSGPIKEVVFYTVNDEGVINNEYSFSGPGLSAPRVGEEVAVRSVRDEEDGSWINKGIPYRDHEDRTVMRGVVEKVSHDYAERGSGPKDYEKRHWVFVKVRETELECDYA